MLGAFVSASHLLLTDRICVVSGLVVDPREVWLAACKKSGQRAEQCSYAWGLSFSGLLPSASLAQRVGKVATLLAIAST